MDTCCQEPQICCPRVPECCDLNANPVIRRKDGGRAYRLRFDVSNYRPEEISVSITPDNKVLITIFREDKTERRIYTEEFTHLYNLPEEAITEKMTAARTSDGILRIEIPLEKKDGNNDMSIPIECSCEPSPCRQKFKTCCDKSSEKPCFDKSCCDKMCFEKSCGSCGCG